MVVSPPPPHALLLPAELHTGLRDSGGGMSTPRARLVEATFKALRQREREDSPATAHQIYDTSGTAHRRQLEREAAQSAMLGLGASAERQRARAHERRVKQTLEMGVEALSGWRKSTHAFGDSISVEYLRHAFDGSWHPDVKAHRVTKVELCDRVLGELDSALIGPRDGFVTMTEFDDYYRDLSSLIGQLSLVKLILIKLYIFY